MKFKHRLILTTVAAMAIFNARAADQHTTTTTPETGAAVKPDSKTVKFIKAAGHDNDAEVAMGELGARKAQNPELKSYCQTLQQDHMAANQQLRPIAQKYGIALDEPRKSKEHLNKFEKEAAGSKFDQKFATEMLKAHQKEIQKYEEAANTANEADVRQYAQAMLPKLHQHFDQGINVAQAVGVDQSTISSYSKKVPGAVGGTGTETNTTKGAGSHNPQQSPSTSGSDMKNPGSQYK